MYFSTGRQSGAAGRCRRFLARALALGILAACAAQSAPPPATSADPAPAVSAFQAELNRLGVDYRVPAEGKAILVNIAAFELIAFQDGEPAFRSRVIVGTPENPTPVLETQVTAVRFRPRWRPTSDMVASGEYADRVWPPGRKNPLGLAAIRLEPGLLVYLHDTNRRDLFAREARALSHGCIRVEQWDRLVAWLLDLPLDEVHRLAEGRRTFDMPAPPVLVTLGYFTTFPDEAGGAVRYPDVYGREVPPASPPEPDREAPLSGELACRPDRAPA